MINKKVTNYKELLAAMDELKESGLKQEALLKQNAKEIKEALNPIHIAKNYLEDIAEDRELHRNVFKTVLSLGAQYFIERFFKTSKSHKPGLATVFLKKLIAKLGV